jgi:hypothetical protein
VARARVRFLAYLALAELDSMSATTLTIYSEAINALHTEVGYYLLTKKQNTQHCDA